MAVLRISLEGLPEIEIPALDALGIYASSDPAHDYDRFLHMPAGAFRTAGLQVPVTSPSAAPIGGLALTLSNASGDLLRNTPSPMALRGVARVCLFVACDEGAPVFVPVPLDAIGRGGEAVASGFVNVTVGGGPWRMVNSWSTSAPGEGRGYKFGASLESPIFIRTSLPALADIPAGANLTVRGIDPRFFARPWVPGPEPGPWPTPGIPEPVAAPLFALGLAAVRATAKARAPAPR